NEARIHQYLELIQKLLSCPYITTIVQNLCIDITNFPLGTRGNNLEIAITGYETVLTLCPRAAFPEKWATTQNNLAIAYSDRIKGDRGENIELAIKYYENALEIHTPESLPINCLQTGNNLGD
ncbi:MAG: tetratricopeptide repeat protein, partial [Sphaerospermopsis kisseleviana]